MASKVSSIYRAARLGTGNHPAIGIGAMIMKDLSLLAVEPSFRCRRRGFYHTAKPSKTRRAAPAEKAKKGETLEQFQRFFRCGQDGNSVSPEPRTARVLYQTRVTKSKRLKGICKTLVFAVQAIWMLRRLRALRGRRPGVAPDGNRPGIVRRGDRSAVRVGIG